MSKKTKKPPVVAKQPTDELAHIRELVRKEDAKLAHLKEIARIDDGLAARLKEIPHIKLPERMYKLSPEERQRQIEAQIKAQKAREAIDRAAAEERRPKVVVVAPQPQPKRKRSSRSDKGQSRLLSLDEKTRGLEHLCDRLDSDPQNWGTLEAASRKLAVFLGRPEKSWQTIRDDIVVEEFRRRGLIKPRQE
jgi:hypothetical protein